MGDVNREIVQVPHTLPRLFSRPDRLDKSPLYVVTPIINSNRSRTRWQHYQNFEKHVAEAGAILYTIEVAFGDRDFVVTTPDDPHDIQMRTNHELWLKERAINLAVSRLPEDWQYMAWVDADCLFIRPDWADETKHLLQHYPLIQMWSQLHDLNKHHELIGQLRSFMDVNMNGPHSALIQDTYGSMPPQPPGPVHGSPGLAWASRREAWRQMGGLIDFCILGAGDWYFAHALMGTLEKAIGRRNDLTGPFVRKLREYQDRVNRAKWEERPLVGNVGLMRGLVVHYYHGTRKNRKYGSRGNILMKYNFDPDLDLKPDWNSLHQLTDKAPGLRREIQQYFASLEDE